MFQTLLTTSLLLIIAQLVGCGPDEMSKRQVVVESEPSSFADHEDQAVNSLIEAVVNAEEGDKDLLPLNLPIPNASLGLTNSGSIYKIKVAEDNTTISFERTADASVDPERIQLNVGSLGYGVLAASSFRAPLPHVDGTEALDWVVELNLASTYAAALWVKALQLNDDLLALLPAAKVDITPWYEAGELLAATARTNQSPVSDTTLLELGEHLALAALAQSRTLDEATVATAERNHALVKVVFDGPTYRGAEPGSLVAASSRIAAARAEMDGSTGAATTLAAGIASLTDDTAAFTTVKSLLQQYVVDTLLRTRPDDVTVASARTYASALSTAQLKQVTKTAASSSDPAQVVVSAVAFADSDAEWIESENPKDITLKITPPLPLAGMVSFTIGGTASADDYQLAASVAVPAGQTTVTVPLSLIDDASYEATETLTIGFGELTELVADDEASTMAIQVVDSRSQPTLSLSATDASETNPAGKFTLSLDHPSSSSITVSYELAGTATLDTDYGVSAATTVTIEPGETSKEITVTVTDDNLDEGVETITLAVTEVSGVTWDDEAAPTVLSIADDDVQPLEISFAAATINHPENGGNLTVTLSLSKPAQEAASVDVLIGEDGTAVLNEDYVVSFDNTLEIAIGDTEITYSITIYNDPTAEADETIILELDNPVGGILGSTTQTTVSIIDED